MVLGVMEDADWFNATVDLPKRSRLLVVTDGVAETFSNQGKMFGRERLGELYAKSAACPVREWPLRLGDDVSTFRGELRQQDDITIVLAECV